MTIKTYEVQILCPFTGHWVTVAGGLSYSEAETRAEIQESVYGNIALIVDEDEIYN